MYRFGLGHTEDWGTSLVKLGEEITLQPAVSMAQCVIQPIGSPIYIMKESTPAPINPHTETMRQFN